MNKYVQGMEEIKADDKLKYKIMTNIELVNSTKQTSKYKFRNAIITFALTLLVVIFISIFPIIQNRQNSSNQLAKRQLFSGFVITAYGKNGIPKEIKPNVKFLLGRYSLTNSSVPGFPIKIVCKDVYTIKLNATNGEFLLWKTENSNVINKGKEIEIKSGDTVYWSPLAQNHLDSNVKTCNIEIKAYKLGKEIGSNIVCIKEESDFAYSGVLLK